MRAEESKTMKNTKVCADPGNPDMKLLVESVWALGLFPRDERGGPDPYGRERGGVNDCKDYRVCTDVECES